jgi:putative ABC transport system permease protein
MRDLSRDLRLALRRLLRAPGFAAVAILTMALGIGLNTSLFSVVHALLLRPLPYPEPERLVVLDAALAQPDGTIDFQLSYPEAAEIAAGARSLTGTVAWSPGYGLAVEASDGAVRLETNFVGPGYFDLLAARPLVGRTFAADEHALDGGELVVVLAEATWRQLYGADPGVVGREVRMQGLPFTVVGVVSGEFYDVALRDQERVDAWVPIERAPAVVAGFDLRARGGRRLWGLARLAPGVGLGAAAAELDALSARLAAEFSESNANFTLRATPLAGTYFADARRALWLLLGGSLFVLAIGCANLANLLLVRATGRTGEMALRLAIGASRGHLVRQLMVESSVLALAGALVGGAAAVAATPLLVRASGLRLPGFARVALDGPVLAAALGATLVSALIFGLAPALWATRRGLRRTLVAGGSRQVARSSRAGSWIAGIEIAAAFVLVAGAVLLVESFAALGRTDLGFRHERLLTVRLELPRERYATADAQARFGERALERLRALPGVGEAVIWGPSMFARSTWVALVAREDQLRDDERTMLWRHSTNPGALGALGIPLRAGRDFEPTDTAGSPPVAIVSEAVAARLWPGQSAIGRRLRSGRGDRATLLTVVGVAADARHRGRFRFSEGAAAFEPQLDVYLPFAQRPNALVTFGVRTAGQPGASTSAVRAALAEVDPALALYDIAPLAERLRDEQSAVGFAALLMNLYGGLAIFLAAIGVYGVLAAGVAARHHEVGIRAALGATPRALALAVLRHGLAVGGAAVAVGLAVAVALGRGLGALLFGVSATEPRALALAAAALLAVAAAASLLPAWRAARVDPVRVLRAE